MMTSVVMTRNMGRKRLARLFVARLVFFFQFNSGVVDLKGLQKGAYSMLDVVRVFVACNDVQGGTMVLSV